MTRNNTKKDVVGFGLALAVLEIIVVWNPLAWLNGLLA